MIRGQGRADLPAGPGPGRCARAQLRCAARRHVRRRGGRGARRGPAPTAVESQIAFLIGSDLAGPGVTTPDALAAIGGVLPCGRGRGQPDRGLADPHRRHGRGQRIVGPGGRRGPDHTVTAVDLRLLGVLSSATARRSRVARKRLSSASARCVAWLANKLGSFGAGCAAATWCVRCAAPDGPGAAGRLLPGAVRASRVRDGAVHRRRPWLAGRAARSARSRPPGDRGHPDRGRAGAQARSAVHPQAAVPRRADRLPGTGTLRRAPRGGR